MLTRRGLMQTGLKAGIASYAVTNAVYTTAPAFAQEPPESWEQQWQRRLREDWPGWGRYAQDNARILAEGQPIDVVYMGDSITEAWPSKSPSLFSKGRICRGVSGETSPQMLLRMIPDVCDLKPRYVHIMAGTNDIAGNTGAMTLKNTQDCYTAMHALAAAHNIGVIFASIPPASAFPWKPGLDIVTPIKALNAWLRDFAKHNGATYIDYHTVLADDTAAMKPGMAFDGVHPTAAGYDAMEKHLSPVIADLLESKPDSSKSKG